MMLSISTFNADGRFTSSATISQSQYDLSIEHGLIGPHIIGRFDEQYYLDADGNPAIIPGSPSPLHTWIGRSWQFDIDGARLKLRVDINALRDAAEFGPFFWDGSQLDATRDSQARIMGLVSLAQMALATSQPFSIDWTLADNSTRTLSAIDALGIGQALGAHVQAAHVTARLLKNLVSAATTFEEVSAISWPSNN